MSAQPTGPAPAPGDGPVPEDAPGDPAGPRPMRSARHQFAATILTLEAFVVLFATLTAFGLRLADPAVVWAVGGSLSVGLVLVAGMLRWPGGYVAGSVLQVVMLGTGVVLPMMVVIGGIFVVLWVVALRLGARIDRERRERGHSVTGA